MVTFIYKIAESKNSHLKLILPKCLKFPPSFCQVTPFEVTTNCCTCSGELGAAAKQRKVKTIVFTFAFTEHGGEIELQKVIHGHAHGR